MSELKVSAQPVVGPRRTSARAYLQRAAMVLVGAARVLVTEVHAHLRLDPFLAVIAVVFLIAFLPVVGRATDTPQMLRCCIVDEPPLSMALDGMRVMPYGDPFNFILALAKGQTLPGYWGDINYAGVGYYYGGVYVGLGFLVYGPLQALGFPPFPTAPVILRVLSELAGLVSLIIIYNFARRHIGRIGAVVAVLLLLTDSFFIYYSTIVHPDMTQLALALLALAVATRHAEDGGVESLLALGLLSGAVQGTKLGGPWLVPMAALAVWFGVRRYRASTVRLLARLVGRGAVLCLTALVAYAVTTPYAFVSPDFLRMTTRVVEIHTSNMLVTTTAWTWLARLWAHFGPAIMILAAVGVAIVALSALFGRVRRGLVLAVILGASQLLWYSLNEKLWVELGYMLVAFAVIALLSGEAVEFARRLAARAGPAGRAAGVISATVVPAAIVAAGWWTTAEYALFDRLLATNTAFQIGRWAAVGNIPPAARILIDNTAYFDPRQFPSAYMRGDLLTYNELYRYHPDYIVLSSDIYDAAHFAELRRTQHYTMQNEGPMSLRLYQDLLRTDRPGPSPVPGIDYVRAFSANAEDPPMDCPAAAVLLSDYRPWLGGDAPERLSAMSLRLFGANPAGRWIAGRLTGQAVAINMAGRLIDEIRGRLCASTGATLRVYRVNQPGAPDGFSEPIASSSWRGLSPLDAFDGAPSHWMPSPDDPAEHP
ncbi:MAG: glycosyltransferase family 39 protein, partial [Alphaproteobacteria bacterium]|nr:glycosyltransferase family 39 protein [Alphaproteobacteria bacterium]MBV9150236.1 glycosyltransferase family 39 protein [Alphaproteobacteria bacterium]